MIETKDILHYYFGCRFKYTYPDGNVVFGTVDNINNYGYMMGRGTGYVDEDRYYEIDDYRIGKIELILTHSSDMTIEQKREYKDLCYKVFGPPPHKKGFATLRVVRVVDTAESLNYLFRNGIDAFDLIENGKVIDAATLLNSTPKPDECDATKPK